MNAQISPKDWQLLSEYLDGQLSPHDQSKLEQRMHSRPELRDGLEDLRRLRSVLRTVPRRKVPHNFTLTRAMVEKPAVSRWMSWIPALSFSSAVATFLLVVSMLIRLPGGVPAAMVSPEMEAPQAMVFEAEPAELAQDSAEAPPIIVWGGQGQVDGRGGMGGGSDATAMEGYGGAAEPEMGFMAIPEGELYADEGVEPPGAEAAVEQPVEEPAMAPAPEAPPEAPALAAAPEEAPEELSDMSASRAMEEENVEPLVGTGPILGVAPAEEQGGMQLKSAPETVMLQENQQQAAQPEMNWLVLQIALVLVAIGTGITALYLKRKSKA
jgi:hypothetical protein